MKKLIIFIPFLLFALDSDLDGVPDNIDLCPNTPFLEIVNKNGCSASQVKEAKKSKIKYNISAGYEYDRYKDYKNSKTLFNSISIKKNSIKFNLYSSFLNDGYHKNYKFNNLIFSIYKYKDIKKINFKFGIKYYFKTYFNKKTDYAFFIQGIKYFNNFDIGLSEQYKIYREKNTFNENTIILFSDIYTKKIYFSPYFYIDSSIYRHSKWYKYAGITLFYPIKNITFIVDYSFNIEKKQNNTITASINYEF